MTPYEVLIPTPDGWKPLYYVAGRNEAEAAAMAAERVGSGNAFRLRAFEYDEPHFFAHPRLPLDYNARACATARMVNPGYLSTAQLELSLEADLADNAGQPF